VISHEANVMGKNSVVKCPRFWVRILEGIFAPEMSGERWNCPGCVSGFLCRIASCSGCDSGHPG